MKFVDCFMLMGTALSLRTGNKLPEMSRPLLHNSDVTFVDVSLTVQQLKFTNVKEMEAQFEVVLNQRWVDPRLGANVRTQRMAVAGQIWKPKITTIWGQNLLTPNEDTVFWRGFGDEGNVLLSEKFLLDVQCTRNFEKFPFDTQFCQIKFGSCNKSSINYCNSLKKMLIPDRFPMEEVLVRWDQNPVTILSEVQLEEFEIINVGTYSAIDPRTSGNFSVAAVHFALKRNNFHYVWCIVLPCLFLTLFNYATFWFELNKRTLRIFINIVIFILMLFYHYVSFCLIQYSINLKAIDAFVLLCELFSVFTVFEIIFVDNICSLEETQFHLRKVACNQEYPKYIYWLELGMKLAYPIFFVFCLVVYGIVYL